MKVTELGIELKEPGESLAINLDWTDGHGCERTTDLTITKIPEGGVEIVVNGIKLAVATP